MKKISKKLFVVLPMLAFLVAYTFVPGEIAVFEGETAEFGLGMSIRADEKGKGKYSREVKLFNFIPIKEVTVNAYPERYLVPSGEAIGVKMYTKGVLVVGIGEVVASDGKAYQPAKDAGIKIGDKITEINGEEISSTSDFIKRVNDKKGNVTFSVIREDEEKTIPVDCVYSDETGSYKAGIWVRDSAAGIGTLTFYNPETKEFGALGHGICDSDTKEIMELSRGSINFCSITNVKRGKSGTPGELIGTFKGEKLGSVSKNTGLGIFGTIESYPNGDALLVGSRYELECGKAEILCDVDGNGPKPYDIEITRISKSQKVSNKSFTIHVTDEELIKKTGGIVQGMSGSPLIQNGKLIGAVTHVFVNDPTRGYGIFIENMLAEAEKISD